MKGKIDDLYMLWLMIYAIASPFIYFITIIYVAIISMISSIDKTSIAVVIDIKWQIKKWKEL